VGVTGRLVRIAVDAGSVVRDFRARTEVRGWAESRGSVVRVRRLMMQAVQVQTRSS
jgi:hypothetical protein